MEKKFLGSLLLSVALLGIGLTANSKEVSAHGYVESPISRGYQGAIEKNTLGWQAAWDKYGAVITNPQSLEAPKGIQKLDLPMVESLLQMEDWGKSGTMFLMIRVQTVG